MSHHPPNTLLVKFRKQTLLVGHVTACWTAFETTSQQPRNSLCFHAVTVGASRHWMAPGDGSWRSSTYSFLEALVLSSSIPRSVRSHEGGLHHSSATSEVCFLHLPVPNVLQKTSRRVPRTSKSPVERRGCPSIHGTQQQLTGLPASMDNPLAQPA